MAKLIRGGAVPRLQLLKPTPRHMATECTPQPRSYINVPNTHPANPTYIKIISTGIWYETTSHMPLFYSEIGNPLLY